MAVGAGRPWPFIAVALAVSAVALWLSATSTDNRDAATPMALVQPSALQSVAGAGLSPAPSDSATTPLLLSPFGAAPATQPPTTHTVDTAEAARDAQSIERLSEPGTMPAVTPLAAATAVQAAASPAYDASRGPPPRSDMRYQVATTWRRPIPH